MGNIKKINAIIPANSKEKNKVIPVVSALKEDNNKDNESETIISIIATILGIIGIFLLGFMIGGIVEAFYSPQPRWLSGNIVEYKDKYYKWIEVEDRFKEIKREK